MAKIFHIGQRKTGTTWLQEVLTDAAEKEDFTFCFTPLVRWWQEQQDNVRQESGADYDALKEIFRSHLDERVFFTMENLIQIDHAFLVNLIYEVCPDAIILVTTRSPKGYLQSSLFNALIGGNMREIERFYENFPRRHMIRTHDLLGLKNAIKARFGSNQLRLLPYELLRDSPDEHLRVVSRLLGVDVTPYKKATRRNASPNPAILQLTYSMNEKLRQTAPDILASDEWRVFKHLALNAAAHAEELQQQFDQHLINKEFSVPEAKLPDDVLAKMPTMLKPLASHNLYQSYLEEYGLTADED